MAVLSVDWRSGSDLNRRTGKPGERGCNPPHNHTLPPTQGVQVLIQPWSPEIKFAFGEGYHGIPGQHQLSIYTGPCVQDHPIALESVETAHTDRSRDFFIKVYRGMEYGRRAPEDAHGAWEPGSEDG